MLIPRLFPKKWKASVEEIRSLMQRKVIDDIRYSYELDFYTDGPPTLLPILSGKGWQFYPISAGVGIFNTKLVPLEVVNAFKRFPLCMCTDEWRRTSRFPFDMRDRTTQAFFDEVMNDSAETGFVERILDEPSMRMIGISYA